MSASRNAALASKFHPSRQLPPPAKTSQQQPATVRPRSSSSPPSNISNLEMYQFKLQNYMFCPEMKDLGQCGSFSTGGIKGSSSEEDFEQAGHRVSELGAGVAEEAEETGHEEDDYVAGGISPYQKTQSVNTDLAISALPLDRLSQEDVPAEKEVDAGDGDENSQPGGRQADQLHQQRAVPGQGEGQAGRGAGHQLNDNALDPGRRTAKSAFQPEHGNRRLLIKINPAKWLVALEPSFNDSLLSCHLVIRQSGSL